MSDKKFSEKEKGMISGIAFSISHLFKRGEDVLAKEILKESGYTLQNFIDTKIDEFDLPVIKELDND